MLCQIYENYPINNCKCFSAQIRFRLSRKRSSVCHSQRIIKKNNRILRISDFFKRIYQPACICLSEKADNSEAFIFRFGTKGSDRMLIIAFSSVLRALQAHQIALNLPLQRSFRNNC